MRIEDYEFWKVVDDLGWATKTFDYEKLNQQLIESKYNMRSLIEIFYRYKVILKSTIFQWENITNTRLGIGDDSFDDLVSHIIGLGQEEYERVMANPELAYDRAKWARDPKNDRKQSSGYIESFAYVFK